MRTADAEPILAPVALAAEPAFADSAPFSVKIHLSVGDGACEGSCFVLDGVWHVRPDGEHATARDLANLIVANALTHHGASCLDVRQMRLILRTVPGHSETNATAVLRPSATLAACGIAEASEVEVQRKRRGGKKAGRGWHKAARSVPQYRVALPFKWSSADEHHTKSTVYVALLLIWFYKVDTVVLCLQEQVESIRQMVDEGKPHGVHVVVTGLVGVQTPMRTAELLIVYDHISFYDLFMKTVSSCKSSVMAVYYLPCRTFPQSPPMFLSRRLQSIGCKVASFKAAELMELMWADRDLRLAMLQHSPPHIASWLSVATEETRSNYDVALDVVASYGGALRSLVPELKGNKLVVLTAAAEWPRALRFASRELRRELEKAVPQHSKRDPNRKLKNEQRLREFATSFLSVLQVLVSMVRPQNVGTIIVKVGEAKFHTCEELKNFAEFIFAGAMDNLQYSGNYAHMVFELQRVWKLPCESGTEPFTLRRAIWNICQDQLESQIRMRSPGDMRGQDNELEKKTRGNRTFGLSRFIGQLFLRKLISCKAMSFIIEDFTCCHDSDMLPDESMIHCTCDLLTHIGFALERSSQGKDGLSRVCERLWDIKDREASGSQRMYSKRIHVLIQEMFDGRAVVLRARAALEQAAQSSVRGMLEIDSLARSRCVSFWWSVMLRPFKMKIQRRKQQSLVRIQRWRDMVQAILEQRREVVDSDEVSMYSYESEQGSDGEQRREDIRQYRLMGLDMYGQG